MSLVLKSNGTYTGDSMFPLSDAFIARVLADGGEIVDIGYLQSAEIFLKANNLADKVFSFASPKFAVKKVGSAVSVIYSLLGSDGDVVIESGASPTFNSNHTVSIVGSSANKYKTRNDIQTGEISLLTAFTLTTNVTTAAALMSAYTSTNRCLDAFFVGSNKTLTSQGVANTMGGVVVPSLEGGNTLATKTSSRGITMIANGSKYNFPASYRNVSSATIRYASTQPATAGLLADYSVFAAGSSFTDDDLVAFEDYINKNFL